MKILSLSTAEQGASLAITDGTELVCEEYWADKQTHSKRLVSMVHHMLENRAGMSLEDMDLFVTARGPGSFTGLRIGISVIKGFACALGKEAVGVSSLDGIAFRYACSSMPVCAMMDARRGEVYCATYRFEAGRLVSKSRERVISPEEAIGNNESSGLYVGSGAKAYQKFLKDQPGKKLLDDAFEDYVSAKTLIRVFNETKNSGDFKGNILVPSYIRKSDAELQFAEK